LALITIHEASGSVRIIHSVSRHFTHQGRPMQRNPLYGVERDGQL